MASLWDSFIGNAQADDISAAGTTANSYLDRGLNQYHQYYGDYLNKAVGAYDPLQPYATAGTDTLSLLRSALGLNGQSQQADFMAGLQSDPGYVAGRDAGIEALDRSAAARGLLRSGGQQRDLYSYGNRFLGDFFNNRVSQLGGLLGSGQQAGTTMATGRSGLFSQAGSDLGNAELGINQLKAGQAINMGNALASSKSTGINNLLGLAKTVAAVAAAPFTGGTSLFAAAPMSLGSPGGTGLPGYGGLY